MGNVTYAWLQLSDVVALLTITMMGCNITAVENFLYLERFAFEQGVSSLLSGPGSKHLDYIRASRAGHITYKRTDHVRCYASPLEQDLLAHCNQSKGLPDSKSILDDAAGVWAPRDGFQHQRTLPN